MPSPILVSLIVLLAVAIGAGLYAFAEGTGKLRTGAFVLFLLSLIGLALVAYFRMFFQ